MAIDMDSGVQERVKIGSRLQLGEGRKEKRGKMIHIDNCD